MLGLIILCLLAPVEHVEAQSSWTSRGDLNVTTNADAAVTYLSLVLANVTEIRFTVRTCGEAQIRLGLTLPTRKESYRIYGTWRGFSQSYRIEKGTRILAESGTYKTSRHCFTKRKLWLSWRNNQITFGTGFAIEEQYTLMKYTGIETAGVSIISIGTSDYEGYWMLPDPQDCLQNKDVCCRTAIDCALLRSVVSGQMKFSNCKRLCGSGLISASDDYGELLTSYDCYDGHSFVRRCRGVPWNDVPYCCRRRFDQTWPDMYKCPPKDGCPSGYSAVRATQYHNSSGSLGIKGTVKPILSTRHTTQSSTTTSVTGQWWERTRLIDYDDCDNCYKYFCCCDNHLCRRTYRYDSSCSNLCRSTSKADSDAKSSARNQVVVPVTISIGILTLIIVTIVVGACSYRAIQRRREASSGHTATDIPIFTMTGTNLQGQTNHETIGDSATSTENSLPSYDSLPPPSYDEVVRGGNQ